MSMRIVLATIGCLALNAIASASPPAPFTATYSASYRGITGGLLTLTLKAEDPPGRFSYETHVKPTWLAEFFVSEDAVEHTELAVTPDGVKPISWSVNDGKPDTKGDGEAHFDWDKMTVTGKDGDKPFELPLTPGVLDRMSIQVAVMQSLEAGHEPGIVQLLDGDKIKDYVYTKTGTASLDTALGKLDTVIYESKRPGSKPSDRVSKFWYAPTLGYITVRAEQIRKGKVETVLVIKELKR
jgi:hypothetical protein